MTINLLITDYWELFEESAKNSGNPQQQDQSDIIYKFPKQLGNGYLREIELCNGLLLTISDYKPNDDIVLKVPQREHSVEFTIRMSGSDTNEYGTCIGAGQSNMCGGGIALGGITKFQGRERHLKVNAHIETELVKTLLCNQFGEVPPELKKLTNENNSQIIFPPREVTTPILVAVQQILNCPYQGLMKRMYLQAKVFELFALQLKPLQENEKAESSTRQLKSEDIERVLYVKDILLARWVNPPSLVELAREAGLNDYKLKIGFRQVFDTTVFGYLHDYRMEQARQLLEQGNLSVAGVARTVGYANRSHFAVAFKRKFGINPNVYLHHKS